MALGLFSSVPVMAQYYDRNGLFDKGGDGHASNANTSVGLMNKGAASVNGNLSNQGFGANESGITNQTFESPIGSGLFVLLAAGAGYAAMPKNFLKALGIRK